jgi:ribosomal protein S18 acetylase RimI-like enzyme
MNASFRLCTEADLVVADDILVAAYQFKGSRKKLLYHYLSLQPDGWWLALVDGNPVGFGGAVDYGAFSSVGMLSVYPSWQRRGIGEALTKQ